MPAERVSMRKIRDVLRLTHALGMSRRLVGEATGIGKTAVGEYVRRAAVAGLSWPIPDEIDDAELERRLFPPADTASCAARTEPDWSHIHAELKGRGVTLALLWQEYRAEHGLDRPGGHRAGRGDHESQAPSRAGLPIVPGHHQPGEDLRVRARRGREPARQRHRRNHLRLDQVNPAERARQSLRQLESAGRPADPARQHPWAWLLPPTHWLPGKHTCG